MCTSLTATNGEVTYSQNNLTVGTVATYTCETGYSLTGLPTQECIENDQGGLVGVWNGTVLTCEGTFNSQKAVVGFANFLPHYSDLMLTPGCPNEWTDSIFY